MEIFKNLNERNISVSFNEGSILKLNISRVNLGVIINIRRFDEKLLLKLTEKELFYEGYSWLIIVEQNNYFKTWEIIRQLHIRIDTDMIIAIGDLRLPNPSNKNLKLFDIQQIYKIRSTNHESCVRTIIGYYKTDGFNISNFINVEERKNFNKLPFRIGQIGFNKTIINIEEISYDKPAVNLIIYYLIKIFNARLSDFDLSSVWCINCEFFFFSLETNFYKSFGSGSKVNPMFPNQNILSSIAAGYNDICFGFTVRTFQLGHLMDFSLPGIYSM